MALVVLMLLGPSPAGLWAQVPGDGPQQTIRSRTILATITGTGSRPLIDLEPDDVVVEEGGEAREVLSLHLADYPIVLIVDDTGAAHDDMAAMSSAAARFVTRIGQRPVALGELSVPNHLLASFDTAPGTVLERIAHLTASTTASPLPLQAAASGARLIAESGAPFSALVVLSEQPIPATDARDREFLTPILESRVPVYVIAKRDPPTPERAPEAEDVLQGLAEQTGGQFTTIYSAVSYSIALDRLADRLATEMMIEYLVPPTARGGDVRIGVRIPGATARGLGVSN